MTCKSHGDTLQTRFQSARESMLKGLEVQLKAAEAFLLLKAVPTVPGHFVGTATPKQHS